MRPHIIVHILQSIDVYYHVVKIIRQMLLTDPFQIFFIYASVRKTRHNVDPGVLFLLHDTFCKIHSES